MEAGAETAPPLPPPLPPPTPESRGTETGFGIVREAGAVGLTTEVGVLADGLSGFCVTTGRDLAAKVGAGFGAATAAAVLEVGAFTTVVARDAVMAGATFAGTFAIVAGFGAGTEGLGTVGAALGTNTGFDTDLVAIEGAGRTGALATGAGLDLTIGALPRETGAGLILGTTGFWGGAVRVAIEALRFGMAGAIFAGAGRAGTGRRTMGALFGMLFGTDRVATGARGTWGR